MLAICRLIMRNTSLKLSSSRKVLDFHEPYAALVAFWLLPAACQYFRLCNSAVISCASWCHRNLALKFKKSLVALHGRLFTFYQKTWVIWRNTWKISSKWRAFMESATWQEVSRKGSSGWRLSRLQHGAVYNPYAIYSKLFRQTLWPWIWMKKPGASMRYLGFFVSQYETIVIKSFFTDTVPSADLLSWAEQNACDATCRMSTSWKLQWLGQFASFDKHKRNQGCVSGLRYYVAGHGANWTKIRMGTYSRRLQKPNVHRILEKLFEHIVDRSAELLHVRADKLAASRGFGIRWRFVLHSQWTGKNFRRGQVSKLA